MSYYIKVFLGEYTVGILFMILYFSFFYFVGSAITKQKKSLPYQFIVGYLVFSFFVALGGIPIMVLELPFMLLTCYLIAVYLALLGYSIYVYKKNNFTLKDNFKGFFKSQWFLYVVCFILLILSLSYISWMWENNCGDDGYYISLLSTYPIRFGMSPASGYELKSFHHMYLFNAYYGELAVYSHYLRIAPTLLCRIFFNYFHYFLFALVVYVLVENASKWMKVELPKYSIQFFSVILLLFSFGSDFLETYNVMQIQDAWQFNTAMYFGSSLVRCYGMFLLILPFIHKKSINWKDVLCVMGIGLVLMSNSNIALPVIVMVPYAYLAAYFLFDKEDKKWKLLGILLVVLYCVAGFVFPNDKAIEQKIMGMVLPNLLSVILIPSYIIFIASFFLKNQRIFKMNFLMCFLFVMVIVNPSNNIFERLCVYDFVAGRFYTMIVYAFIILNFTYFVIYIYSKFKDRIHLTKVLSAFGCLLVICSVAISQFSEVGFLQAMVSVLRNPELQPRITVEIGDILERRYEETGKYNVAVVDEGMSVDFYGHTFGTIIRSETPHTVNLSATRRFGVDETGEYSGFGFDDILLFYDFEENPNEDTMNAFMDAIDDVDVNCIVVHNEESGKLLETVGFTLYDTAFNNPYTYYVYVK